MGLSKNGKKAIFFLYNLWEKDKNFQSEARMKRLSFFNDVMNKYSSKYLFLAHHLNDDIETSLMHIIRGSNLKGYAGIKEISDLSKYSFVEF